MRRLFNIITLVLLLCAQTVSARNAEGVVRSGKTPLEGVVVTDGKSFARTDDAGRFALAVADDADFVYIVTPSGYIAPQKEGFPIFYRPADAAQFDFDLLPFKCSGTDYVLLAVGDPQASTARHFERMAQEAAPDLKATGKRYAAKGIAVAGLYLGDMMWDNLQDIPRFRSISASTEVPFYPLIGNHDHDRKSDNDHTATSDYRRWFGPTYYAFCLGGDYYIILDNIDYKGNKVYTEDLTPAQVDWVRAYAQYIPKGANVTLAMHSPVKKYFKHEGGLMESAPALLEIFRDHKLSFMTGHSHIQSNFEMAPGVREHMVASIGGAWWLGESSICKDGTPAGYQVFESKDGVRTWYYKTLGHDPSHQMRLFGYGAFDSRPKQVTAKIWNYNPDWKVEWLQDGKPMGEMEQFVDFDPEYTSYLEARRQEGKAEVGGYRKPVRSFMFFAAKPSPEARRITVIATDSFGNRYTEEIAIKAVKQ